MDEPHPDPVGLGRGPEFEGLTPDGRRLESVRRVIAGQQLDDRRLAGAVLPDESVDLADADVEPGAVERHLSGEGLDHPGQMEQRFCGCGAHGRPSGREPDVRLERLAWKSLI